MKDFSINEIGRLISHFLRHAFAGGVTIGAIALTDPEFRSRYSSNSTQALWLAMFAALLGFMLYNIHRAVMLPLLWTPLSLTYVKQNTLFKKLEIPPGKDISMYDYNSVACRNTCSNQKLADHMTDVRLQRTYDGYDSSTKRESYKKYVMEKHLERV